jgi:hypothetical protein
LQDYWPGYGFGYAAVIFMEALLEIWHPCSSLLYGILYVV